jgi:phosphatidylglycerophosphatase A
MQEILKKNEERPKPKLSSPEVFFLSLGGIGFLPKSPGTFASLATIIPLYLLGQYNAPFILFIPILLIMFGVSIFLIGYVQKKFKIEDPSWIVIDELFGVFAMWPFLQSKQYQWALYLLGFIFFRALDIFKPGPIGLIDRKLKNGFGVMLDDILAGFLAGFFCLLLIRLLNLA